MSDVSLCLEIRGSHLIPFYYCLSCSSACSHCFFKSCLFFLLAHSPDFLQYFSLRDMLVGMALFNC